MANAKWDDKWTTKPAPLQAHAFLGLDSSLGHSFRFNPDEVVWDYTNNIFSQDTLGGRVIQLISVSLNSLSIAGRAGSRGELQRLAKNVKEIMGYHVHQLSPVEFVVPSRNWHFKVYVKSMPTITWDISSTSYPYQLNLLVEEDLNGVKTRQINSQVLKRLSSGIGYDYSKEVHGGDALVYKKQFEVLYNSQADGGGDGGGGSGGGGGKTNPEPVINKKGCGTPPNLVNYRGMTLQRGAMTAFKNAEVDAKQKISVVSSYRTCQQQQDACNGICGNGCGGCPGQCAPCGESFHQRGLAIDIGSGCFSDKVKKALTSNGWCFPESLRSSDPCHASYDGCG